MADQPSLPARVGHYAIVRRLGEGGMGVVYAARDEKLQRTVALKTMSSIAPDETARRRFWREARAAASVNHPNICQIYEIGDDEGQLFIAMELLEGEVLSDRMRHGALSLAEVMPIGFGMLSALSALHAAGIVHRDLKPVERLPDAARRQAARLRPGASPAGGGIQYRHGDGSDAGRRDRRTPRYMAPEQINGETVDSRGDLFAAGAILFEMLAGRPAFVGRSIVEILHATRFEQPPALTGSPAVAAVDRVIRRALAKRPADRPPSATVMAEELRAITGADGHDTASLAHALTRLVVLPFRVLRPDPETDFLAFSLPDAITTSLGATRSLVLRSSAIAARFAAEAPDLKTLATEADVGLRGDGHAAACRALSSACRRTAHRSAQWHRPDVAYRHVIARRSVRAPGRHRPPHRRGAVAPADRDDHAPADAGSGRTTRARTSSTSGPTSWLAPTTAFRPPAISISRAWS
jgi:serine/threonine protein kinase